MPHPDAEEYCRFLEDSGIAASVIYPTAGLGYGFLKDKEWARELARGYNKALKDLPLQLPVSPPGFKHIFHLYSLLTKKRDALAAHLEKKGVGAAVYYPSPLHLESCFKSLGYRNGDFPVAERISRQILSLPVYPELTESRQADVIAAIQDFFNSR